MKTLDLSFLINDSYHAVWSYAQVIRRGGMAFKALTLESDCFIEVWGLNQFVHDKEQEECMARSTWYVSICCFYYYYCMVKLFTYVIKKIIFIASNFF